MIDEYGLEVQKKLLPDLQARKADQMELFE